jgi:hypothetical protein
MIHIFFVPGMFGSTVEYVLRSFTKEYEPVNSDLLPDGSMHSFNKEFHPESVSDIKNFKNLLSDSITTPTYPFKQAHLPEILNEFEPWLTTDHSLLIYADCLRSAELNLLFQYHKIATGFRNNGLGIFCEGNQHNIVLWNADYKHWTDLQPWELREWFSLFYVSWTQEWTDSYNQVPKQFLRIPNIELLMDTKNTFLKIINFCGLTPDSQDNFDKFVLEWQKKQNYIVGEFELLDQIVDHTLNKSEHSWKDLNIIAESIVQQRLRSNGYEIRCDGLNTFPTDSISLYNLLEKC